MKSLIRYPRAYYEGGLHKLLKAVVKDHLRYWGIPYKDMDKSRYAYKRRPDLIAYRIPSVNGETDVELTEAWGRVFLASSVHVFNIECLTKRKDEDMQEVVYEKIKYFSKYDIGIVIVVSNNHYAYFKQISKKTLEICRTARHVQLWSVDTRTGTVVDKYIVQINDPVGLNIEIARVRQRDANNRINQRRLTEWGN
ncbi:MAG: hypothetical protein QXR45_15325 [Candidatus Bathyarchaeia archaeon]